MLKEIMKFFESEMNAHCLEFNLNGQDCFVTPFLLMVQTDETIQASFHIESDKALCIDVFVRLATEFPETDLDIIPDCFFELDEFLNLYNLKFDQEAKNSYYESIFEFMINTEVPLKEIKWQ